MLRILTIVIIALLLSPLAYFLFMGYSGGNVIASLLIGFVAAVVTVVVVGGFWRLGLRAFLKHGIEALLIGIVVFTCLAFGGTPGWTWLFIEIASAAAVILWAVRMIVERKIVYVKTPLNLLLVLLLLYIFFQLVPLPAAILRTFQSNTLRVYTVGPPQAPEAAALPLGGGPRYAVSLDRARTRGHLFLYMSYVAFFLVLMNNVSTRQQLGRMVGTIMAVGAVVVISGFATVTQDERLLYRRFNMGGEYETPSFLNVNADPEFSAGYGFVFAEQESAVIEPRPMRITEESDEDHQKRLDEWQKRQEQTQPGRSPDWYVSKTRGGDVFGGFPNSNSAAALMVMVLMLALGVVFAYVSTRGAEWGKSGGLLHTREGNLTMLAVLTALLLIAGLLVSRSRGGIAVMAAAVPVLVVLVAFSRSLRAGVITVVTIAVLVVVPLAVIGVGNVSGFIGERAAAWLNPWEGEIRTLGRQAARHISGDYPLFGTGLGTFVNVYPSYKVRGPMLYFAHCDVLQWKAEMGWVGMILAAAILLATLFTVVTGWFRIKDPFFRRLLVGITLGCAACLMHGLVDYPLRIPGVAIVFVALAALSVVVARDRVARHEESDFVF